MKNNVTELKNEYMTVAEMAAYLNISQTSAYELIHRKDFPVSRFGGSIRIPKTAFLAWVDMKTSIPRELASYMSIA